MKNKNLKNLKVVFKIEDGDYLSVKDFQNLIDNTKDIKLKNFFRGCKHTLERHYTEAIKWFQLSEDLEESILLILFNSLKLKDIFLYKEYKRESLKEFNIFKKFRFYPFIKDKDLEFPLDIKTLNQLEKELRNDTY